LILLTAGGQYQARPLPELAPPVKIMADWQPIAVEIGHAAPFVWDINHDGLKDLMVGMHRLHSTGCGSERRRHR
jgi:hypothetical protein